MMLRRWEMPPENLGAHCDPLAFPPVTSEKLPNDDDQSERQASEENLFREWNLLTRKL